MGRKATIQRRSEDDAELTDTTNTPKWIADLLPVVDLDPWSNDLSHIKSRWSYSLEKKLDGLKLPHRGSIFSNWPFSNPLPYARKIIEELSIGRCTEAIILCKLDTSTDWYSIATSFNPFGQITDPLAMPPDLWLFNERVEYDEHPEIIRRRKEALEAWKAAGGKESGQKRPPGNAEGKSSTNFCSAIIHHRGPVMKNHASGTRWCQRPPLKLESVAKRWLLNLPDGLKLASDE
jgi:hypothetical protein